MGLPTGRVNARSGRVCMFVCANVHAPFLCKAPYLVPHLGDYSRSPKTPTLQLLQKSSKSACTTPQRPVWNTSGTVAVRDFWENGCNL